jgi:hypothetical protein
MLEGSIGGTFRIPDPQSSVLASRGDALPIRAKGDGVNRSKIAARLKSRVPVSASQSRTVAAVRKSHAPSEVTNRFLLGLNEALNTQLS